MSTPRTDVESWAHPTDGTEVVNASFARELERELTRVTAERDKLQRERDSPAIESEWQQLKRELAECRENGQRLLEAADGWKLVAQETNWKVEESVKQIRILEIKNAGSLANNLCPDHRDKQTGKPCLACLLERSEKRAEAAEAEVRRMREALDGIAGFAVGNGDVCEIIAKRARDAARGKA